MTGPDRCADSEIPVAPRARSIHAKKERVGLFGTDQRITSGPAVKRPHSKAGYMTAPERFADSQIPLAPRAPSIHAKKERASLFGTDQRITSGPAAAFKGRIH